jgi:inhibitor of KinA
VSEPLLRSLRVSALGDCVLMVEVGDDASAETGVRVRSVAEDLLAHPIAGVVDVVPAVCSVALHYDPLAVELVAATAPDAMADEVTPYARLAQQVTERLTSLNAQVMPEPRTVEIPVCYGGDYGEDLDELARTHSMRADEVIALHVTPLYRVQMVGFAPGFAYLSGLDQRLVTPRRSTPRKRVPSGSVGIGGELTGVYPLALPGGWHVIGCSPLMFFAVDHDPPSRLSMGDQVRFVPISASDYERLYKERTWL